MSNLLKFVPGDTNTKETKKNRNDSVKENRLLFLTITKHFEELLETRSTLEKEDIIAKFLSSIYKQVPLDDLSYYYQLAAKDFANLVVAQETGISTELFLNAVSLVLKMKKDDLKLKNKGDWGDTIERIYHQQQFKPSGSPIDVKVVCQLIIKLPTYTGTGSQKKKVSEISAFLRRCSPLEAKYFTRLMLGDSLKTGAKDKLIQRAFFKTFSHIEQYSIDLDHASKTRKLNFGQGIVWILEGEGEKVKDLKMIPGFPIELMLAEIGSIETVSNEEHFIEYKYDGFRLQAHYDGKKVSLFSRGLESQTENLPDIKDAFKEAVNGHTCITDGEVLAYDQASGTVLPFQTIIRRKRKHDRNSIARTMRTEYRIFDIMYLDGIDLTNEPLRARRKKLETIIISSELIQFSEKIVTQDPEKALEFIHKAKELGHEGGMIKPASSQYFIGERKKEWSKIKPQTYDVDGCLIGGQMGTGKRANMISRVFVAFPISETEEFEVIDVAIGSGMSEEIMIFLKELLDQEGIDLCPANVRIAPETAAQVEKWIVPEKSPVLEIVADSFSWKTTDNTPISKQNVPLYQDRYDLTKISLRFPRCKGIREKGKKANTMEYVIEQINKQLKGEI